MQHILPLIWLPPPTVALFQTEPLRDGWGTGPQGLFPVSSVATHPVTTGQAWRHLPRSAPISSDARAPGVIFQAHRGLCKPFPIPDLFR